MTKTTNLISAKVEEFESLARKLQNSLAAYGDSPFSFDFEKECKSFLTKALTQLATEVAEQEKNAWLGGERCEECGAEKKPHPTWGMCKKCTEEA